jgi:hypothetical protein
MLPKALDKMFSVSSEKQPGQHELFNEAEEIAALEEDEPNNAQDVEPKVKRKRAAPRQFPKDLPREVIVHDIAPSDKICDCCQSEHDIFKQQIIKAHFRKRSFWSNYKAST